MNAKNDSLPDNANAQSIVIKVVEKGDGDIGLGSSLLTGDTDAVTWKDIRRSYNDADLSCDILLASHHGSLTYFDDPTDTANYYTSHIKAKSPAMTIISVGPNSHGHPDGTALEFYENNSSGSKQGNKVFRTDTNGTMKLVLKGKGGWSLSANQ